MSSIGKNIDNAGAQVARTASHARASVIELGAQALRLVNNLREAEDRTFETVLSRIGLQRRQSAVRPLIWFAAGAVVAGGAALLLAPMKGQELTNRISSSMRKAVQGASSMKTQLESGMRVGADQMSGVEGRL